MIRGINQHAAEAARMMTEWAANELRAIGLQVSVAIEQGEPGRVIIEEARKWGRRFDLCRLAQIQRSFREVQAGQYFDRTSDEGAVFRRGRA